MFDHVTFGYDPANPVVRDIDLRIRAGETVAFVGQTGAGKSTLAKLITRFYDPTEGRVLIDGHDIGEVTLDSFRRQLGVVPQEPFLFAGSLRYNIAFARPDSTDDEVWEAVNAVGLAEVVERMPDGLDTVVHERGQSLSSGERQLIALARAFLAQPRVLVLDEATSNLDLLSETKIEAALDVLLARRTAVLIAHRLTTAMKADRIVVIDDGRVSSPARTTNWSPRAAGTPTCTRPGPAIWSSRRSPAVRLSSAPKRRVAMTAGGLMFATEGLAATAARRLQAHENASRKGAIPMQPLPASAS